MRLNTSVIRYISTVALLTAVSIPHPVVARGASGSVADTSSIIIDNFGRIDANYYRGAQPQGADYTALATLGVKTVINLTSDDAEPDEQAMTEQAGMSYVQIPMTTRVPPTPAQLAQFLGIVNDSTRRPVYVHCVGGKHRTGVMTAAYRMTAGGWTADKAFKEMKEYKFGADFLHPEFKAFVYGYRPETVQLASASADR